MINETTVPTNVSNIALPPRIGDALWLSSTLPWQLDEPWEYENDIAYNTPVNNQTI
jgi:hypothetical protein